MRRERDERRAHLRGEACVVCVWCEGGGRDENGSGSNNRRRCAEGGVACVHNVEWANKG